MPAQLLAQLQSLAPESAPDSGDAAAEKQIAPSRAPKAAPTPGSAACKLPALLRSRQAGGKEPWIRGYSFNRKTGSFYVSLNNKVRSLSSG